MFKVDYRARSGYLTVKGPCCLATLSKSRCWSRNSHLLRQFCRGQLSNSSPASYLTPTSMLSAIRASRTLSSKRVPVAAPLRSRSSRFLELKGSSFGVATDVLLSIVSVSARPLVCAARKLTLARSPLAASWNGSAVQG